MSWKKYGGINKYDNAENIITNSLVVDNFTIKDYYYGLLDISGNENISGNIVCKSTTISKDLMIYNSSILNGELYVDGETVFNGNILQVGDTDLSGSLYIGGDLIISGDIGLSNTFVLGSDFILEQKLIFNESNNAYLYGNDIGYVGINTTDPEFQFDISSNFSNILNVYSSQESNYSVLARNNANRGILVGSDSSSSYIEFFNDTEIFNQTNQFVYDALIEYQTGGILIFDVARLTNVKSKLMVRNDRDYLQYLPNYYNHENGQIDYATNIINPTNIGMVIACAPHQTTGLHIGSDISGLTIYGGTYPEPNSSNNMVAFGSIGVTANSTYMPAMNIISAGDPHNKTSLGINTYVPKKESALNVNGVVYITNGNIDVVDISFEMLKFAMYQNTIIGVGAAYNTYTVEDNDEIETTRYAKKYLISTDNGNTWTYKDYGSENSNIESRNTPINDVCFLKGSGTIFKGGIGVIAGGLDILYSLPEYSTWKTFSNIFSIVPNPTINIIGLFSIPTQTNTELLYLLTDTYIIYFEIDNSIYAVNNYNAKYKKYGYIVHGVQDVRKIAVEGDYIHVLGISTYKLYKKTVTVNGNVISSIVNTFIAEINISLANGYFNNLFVRENNLCIAGTSKIFFDNVNFIDEYFSNSLNDTTSYIFGSFPINNDELFDVYILSQNIAFVTGKQGIYYTKTYPINWEKLPENVVNSQGNSFILEKDLREIYVKDKTTFFTSKTYTPGISGKSQLINCYFPNLLDEDANLVLDISGSMRVSGNVNVEGGKIASTNPTFHLINTNVTTIFFGGDASNITVGNDENLTTFNHNINVLHDTSLNGNLFVDDNAFFHKNVFVDIDATVKRDLLVLRDISGNREMKIDGNSYITSTLGVGKTYARDNYTLDVEGNTIVTNDVLVNRDVAIDRDLLVSRDISGNREMKIDGNSYIRSTLGVGKTYAGTGYTLDVLGNSFTSSSAVIGIDASINRDVYVQRDISGNRELRIGGNSYIASTLGVGKRYASTGYTVDISGNSFISSSAVIGVDASVNRDVNVHRDITGNRELRIEGNSYIRSTLGVGKTYAGTGYALDILGNSFTSSSAVIGLDASVNRDVNVRRDISGNRELRIGGNSSLYGMLDVSGDTRLSSGLSVQRDVSMNQNLWVVGDISGNRNARVGGNSALYGILDVSGETRLSSGLIVRRDVSFNQNLWVAGDMSLNRNARVGGNSALYGILDVSGDTRLSSGLFVQRDVSLNQNLWVVGDMSLNRNARVGGNSALYGMLDVSGDTRLSSGLFARRDVSFNQNLWVVGDISGNGNARVGGNSALYGMLDVSGDSRLWSGLFVRRDVSLNQNLWVAGDISGNGNARVGGNSTINGQAFFRSRIHVDGSANFGRLIVAMDDVSLNRNVAIDGSLNVNGNIRAKGDFTLDRKMFVSGDASLNKVFLYGDLSSNANVFVKGKTTLKDTLTTEDVVANLNVLAKGDLQVDKTITVSGKLTCLDSVDVTKNINATTGTVNANIITAVSASISNDLTVYGNVDAKNSLSVTNIITSAKVNTTDISCSILNVLDTITSSIIIANDVSYVNVVATDISASNIIVNDVSSININVRDMSFANIRGFDVSSANLYVTGNTTMNHLNVFGMLSSTFNSTFANISGNVLTIDSSASMNKLVINGTNSVAAGIQGTNFAVYNGNVLFDLDCSINKNLYATESRFANISVTNKASIDDGNIKILNVEGMNNMNSFTVRKGSSLFEGDISANRLLKTQTLDASNAQMGELRIVGVPGSSSVPPYIFNVSAGNAYFGNDLKVVGNLNTEKLIVTNRNDVMKVEGNLDISGQTMMNDLVTKNQKVDGSANISGNVFIGNNITAQVDASFGNLLTVPYAKMLDVSTNRLYVMENSYIKDSSFGTLKTHIGNAAIMNVTSKITANDASINALDVIENSGFRKNVTVNDTLIVDKQINTGGNISVNGVSSLKGNTTVDGTLSINGNVIIDNAALAQGNVSINTRNVSITSTVGDVTIKPSTSGNIRINGNSIIGGSTSLNGTSLTTTVNSGNMVINARDTTINSTSGNTLISSGNITFNTFTDTKILSSTLTIGQQFGHVLSTIFGDVTNEQGNLQLKNGNLTLINGNATLTGSALGLNYQTANLRAASVIIGNVGAGSTTINSSSINLNSTSFANIVCGPTTINSTPSSTAITSGSISITSATGATSISSASTTSILSTGATSITSGTTTLISSAGLIDISAGNANIRSPGLIDISSGNTNIRTAGSTSINSTGTTTMTAATTTINTTGTTAVNSSQIVLGNISNNTQTSINGTSTTINTAINTIGGSQLTINSSNIQINNNLNVNTDLGTIYATYYEGKTTSSDIYIGTLREPGINDPSRNIFIGTKTALQNNSTKNNIYIGGGDDEVFIVGAKEITTAQTNSTSSNITTLTCTDATISNATITELNATSLGTRFIKNGKILHLNVFDTLEASGSGIKIYDLINSTAGGQTSDSTMPENNVAASMLLSSNKNAFIFGTNLGISSSNPNKVALDITQLKSVFDGTTPDSILVLKNSAHSDANFDIIHSGLTTTNIVLKNSTGPQTIDKELTINNKLTVVSGGIVAASSNSTIHNLTVGGQSGLKVENGPITLGTSNAFTVNEYGFIKQF
jgi:predicted acyltransferase (DUF342 family)